jgi:DNA-binding CsgD family transcriptional regulator
MDSSQCPHEIKGDDKREPDRVVQQQRAQSADANPEMHNWPCRAASSIDFVREHHRESVEAAAMVWQGLIAGRWSLVGRFDRSGRRYVVAKKNAPQVWAAKALTARELRVVTFIAIGQTNKFIACELELSESYVSECVKRACAKLGVRSRLELVRILRESNRRSHSSPALQADDASQESM